MSKQIDIIESLRKIHEDIFDDMSSPTAGDMETITNEPEPKDDNEIIVKKLREFGCFLYKKEIDKFDNFNAYLIYPRLQNLIFRYYNSPKGQYYRFFTCVYKDGKIGKTVEVPFGNSTTAKKVLKEVFRNKVEVGPINFAKSCINRIEHTNPDGSVK